jgi:hypothetical protein
VGRGAKVKEPDYEALVRKQLGLNAHTWKLLSKHGVTSETMVKLDFFFIAPNKEAAEKLASVIKNETDYVLSSPRQTGPFWRKEWSVSGSTQETKVSAEILDQWVIWMVMAGKRGGGCVFDGWGAEVPKT